MKEVILMLLSELPEDTVVAKYMSTGKITAVEMIALAESDAPIAKTFTADYLRMTRDMLVRGI